MDLWNFRVYVAAVEFHRYVCDELGCTSPGHKTELEEASRSVCDNIAEGFGRRAWGEKKQLYGYARGSLYECIGELGMVKARKKAPPDRIEIALQKAAPVVRMLTPLVAGRRASSARR